MINRFCFHFIKNLQLLFFFQEPEMKVHTLASFPILQAFLEAGLFSYLYWKLINIHFLLSEGYENIEPLCHANESRLILRYQNFQDILDEKKKQQILHTFLFAFAQFVTYISSRLQWEVLHDHHCATNLFISYNI